MAGGRFGTIPLDVERAILQQHRQDAEADEPAEDRRPALVAPSFEAPATWTIPLVVPSLANARDWRVRNRVSKTHRTTVNRFLAMQLAALVPLAFAYHHAGRSIWCKLTRLGGRALDRTANLPAALKYVEDAVCLKLGLDDGCPRWRCECYQEPGGPSGVRIELGIVEERA